MRGKFHNDDGSFKIPELSKACKPIIEDILGDECDDPGMPAKCFALCKDILKKRKSYLTIKNKNAEGKICIIRPV